MKNIYLTLAVWVMAATLVHAQKETPDFGTISGNFQTDVQYYVEDTLIDPTGIAFPKEQALTAGFLNLTYSRKNFIAGIRYENYQNNLIGLPVQYQGQGIVYRYARFTNKYYDITAGNFYDQFGSGLILRTFEERGLGIDNNLDGLRAIFYPAKGITFKGLVGRQRKYFETSESIVRGGDAEWNLRQSIGWDSRTNLILGGSFVSKFEDGTHPQYELPENVASYAGRANLTSGPWNFFVEYARKDNDPSRENEFIYRSGEALYATAAYTAKNWGLFGGYKRYDNMLTRSERSAINFEVLMNFLPSLTKQHTYTLPALYSYNTLALGETGFQFETYYRFNKGTPLGGKYGTLVSVNYSFSHSIDKDYILRPQFTSDSTYQGLTQGGTDGYSSSNAGFGDIKYFHDFNIEFKKKLNKKWKATLTYYNFGFNDNALRKGVTDFQQTTGTDPLLELSVNCVVLELLYKIKPRHSIRTEFQWLGTNRFVDGVQGDWALALVEYSIAPKWFFAIQDSYNYSHSDSNLEIHYVTVNAGYTVGTTRLQVGYGRQQAGIFCVGGICRPVPASNGMKLTLTSNF